MPLLALIAATCVLHGQLPDPHCTPGLNMPTVTQRNIASTICKRGWTASVRDVTSADRRRIYQEYGLSGPHPFPAWEVDHRVPLELGGSNSDLNLWPQENPHQKDLLENGLNDRVCDHTMRLSTARAIFMHDWRKRF